ncbi:hypothetical protein LTR86_008470 [Recurvomyces mirabilis]|nr:hypothetical protein LTR86_008470 [Recurvomyces mirabilis]
MPTPRDIARFLGCQALGTTTLPRIDLKGRTFLITGANTGLGLDAAKHLQVVPSTHHMTESKTANRSRLHASRLILGCRNLAKGEAAKISILEETNCEGTTTIEIWEVDLDSYSSVRAFTSRLKSQLQRLDGFIANAGIELTAFETSEGLERTLTINVISTYLMVLSLYPLLQSTAERYQVDTHLTIVGSLIHYFGPDAQLDVPAGTSIIETLNDPKTADMASRYPLSKLMVHLVFQAMLHHLPKHSHTADTTGTIVNLVNPGWCSTELGRNKDGNMFEKGMFAMIGRTGEEGSRTLVHGVIAGRETHGFYLSECKVKPQSSYVDSERGRSMAGRLWEEVVARIGRVDPEVVKAFL